MLALRQIAMTPELLIKAAITWLMLSLVMGWMWSRLPRDNNNDDQ